MTPEMCDAHDCLADAEWQPELVMYSDIESESSRLMVDRKYCPFHQAFLALEDIVPVEAWNILSVTFVKLGCRAPSRENTTLNWHRLQEASASTDNEPTPSTEQQ